MNLSDLLDNWLPVPSVPPPPPRPADGIDFSDPTIDLTQRIATACLYLDRLRLRGGANPRELTKLRHFLQTGEKQW